MSWNSTKADERICLWCDGEKHEAVMKTITARRRAMIIDDERRKMSKLGEEKGSKTFLISYCDARVLHRSYKAWEVGMKAYLQHSRLCSLCSRLPLLLLLKWCFPMVISAGSVGKIRPAMYLPRTFRATPRYCQACGWLAPFRSKEHKSGLDWRWLMF
jgi:hypothetical protein